MKTILNIPKYAAGIASAFMMTMTTSVQIQAAPAEKYAKSSALARGNWVRIDIQTPGLQTINKQTLSNFGFNDPSKVYVYGYGGRMISEILSEDQPDDLPAVPTVRTADGSITFYAAGNIGITTGILSSMSYNHTINPYCESTYYFLSDQAPESETTVLDLSDLSGLTPQTRFTSQLVHERDLAQCAESGRDYLGEDFRTNKSQEFKFDLPDNADGNARIRVKFGANTSGAQSSIMLSANGTRLAATNTDRIPAVTSSEQYYATTTTIKQATGVGNALTLGIEYSPAGVVNTARLDWIEVEYERELKMRDSQLYFTVNPKQPTSYTIGGATSSTRIWDVTNPGDIKEVEGHFDEANKTLSIAIRQTGLREFMAFEPGTAGAAVPGKMKIPNQDIHAMPTPDMVIISPDAFTSAAEKIANLHRQLDGMIVYVLTPEKIYNEFSGGHADVSAFRKLLKMWYDRGLEDPEGGTIKYCLLMGRPTYDQKRKNQETISLNYPNTLIWQSGTGLTETTSYCTDDFIGMLEDETTQTAMEKRTINVGVGRYPVTSLSEANILAEKLETYMMTPEYGMWRNNVMVIADDDDNGQHLDQAESSIGYMQQAEAGRHYAYEKLYLDAFEQKNTGTGPEFPDAKERMLKKWSKEGVALINYIGHANPKEWGHEKLLTWKDINSMSNQHLPILYAATCSFGKWDIPSVSGAEIMLSNPAGGAIALVTPSRTVFITKNKDITNAVSNEIMKRGSDGKGRRIGDIIRLGKNSCQPKDDNMNRYHLFGDPALRMPLADFTVNIDAIGGAPVAENQADAPTLKARSSVDISGTIIDMEGNIVDFNGPVQYILFDAEKSVTTHGWGDNGKVDVYQDRSSKLATGSTMAINGRWKATIKMPAEISNNYMPAMLTMYAYDSSKATEANGSTDKLFVYGYDSEAGEDTEGPKIEKFVINSDSFSDGDVVHSSPVAIATFSDESGINISDAGIGHKMSLVLDNKKVYEDLDNYYTPDTETDGKGSIAYPLSNLEPGDHELKLIVWDNANNSSEASLAFNVGLNMRPDLIDVSTVYDRDKDLITMNVKTDRSLCKLKCRFECFTLTGQKVWSSERNIYSGRESIVSQTWDLKDSNGNRLPRGIYILRANVETEDGMGASKSKKIAVSSVTK